MITALYYNIKFSSTGKTFSQKINFKPGLTVITGANEKGKSLILEMIEYALFGVDALRGQWSDYDLLEVDMTWESKGESHTVSRHGKIQTLDKNKAVGAAAVNKAIIQLLGIGLDVFRIACSAKQGELDKLTARMRPTERRKMVDEVIGLNQLESVEKLCRSEGNSIKRLRDDLSKRAIEPTALEEPELYTSSLILEAELREQLKVEAEREQLLKVVKPILPIEPSKGEFSDDVDTYESLRTARVAEREGLERTLRSIPTVTFSRSDIDYAREFYEYDKLGPMPIITRAEAETWLDAWSEIARMDQSVHCPNCGVDFIPGEGMVQQRFEPAMSVVQIKEQLKALDKWEGIPPRIFSTRPVMTFEEMQSAELALAQEEVRLSIEKQLAEIPVMESREEELKAMILWEKLQLFYTHQLERYVEDLANWSDTQSRLAELPEPRHDLEKNLRTMQVYEEQKRTYDASMLAYESAIKELEELNESIEAYTNGAEALKFVRSQVKQHLVPSLNKVASHLLSEMTNGQRSKIIVDEDFEVYVDGQPVRTLSGSGVSVVNLALRIALGQVLTQRVIPIFLADEIDHDMDPDRAAATHAAVKSLSSTLKQIIVVSHKQIDGDNMIGV